jgi:hypothetical protein
MAADVGRLKTGKGRCAMDKRTEKGSLWAESPDSRAALPTHPLRILAKNLNTGKGGDQLLRGATFARGGGGQAGSWQLRALTRCGHGAKRPGGLAGVGVPLPWTSRP